MGKARTERSAAAKRLEEERAAQAAATRRRNVLIALGAVVVVVLLAAVVGVVIAATGGDDKGSPTASPSSSALPSAKPSSQPTSTGAVVAPAAADGFGDKSGILIGPAGGERAFNGLPLIEVYEDFQGTASKEFEAKNGATLRALAVCKKAGILYKPVNVVGATATTPLAQSSSLRASSAFGCSTTASQFLDWHDTAFKNQPPQGEGITDAQMSQWGVDVGIDGAWFPRCVGLQNYLPWAQKVAAAAAARGVTTQPTVFVKDKKLTPAQLTPEGIKAAVAAATTGKISTRK